MTETLTYEQTSLESDTRQLRLLTEVEHLRTALLENDTIPEEILADVKVNLQTAVYEMSMPLAVSVTAHRVEYHETEDGQREKVITWLGRNAVDNALSGKLFHNSEAAYKRVDVEVAEAKRAQEYLKPGIAQVFISPKMSRHDAPAEVAIAEHLHDDDSLRVSYAVTNNKGEVVSRRLESLLVRDVPLEAWVEMLTDPNNLFGKPLDIADRDSALSVMELFDQLELSEEAIPEGPVTLVEAVLPYIRNEVEKTSVAIQLDGFRSDQLKYREQAERTAQEWLEFETELARSLIDETATYEIERFIVGLQDIWSQENLRIINSHSVDGRGWRMSRELAAMLEDSKRQTLNSIAGLKTGNKDMIRQVDASKVESIVEGQRYLDLLRMSGISQHDINALQMELEVKVARENIEIGGGCAGKSANNFGGPSTENDKSDSSEKDWKWKRGKCVVKTCPSPNPTEVGPCSVCRKCQSEFDKGNDPTKPSIIRTIKAAAKQQKSAPSVTKTI